MTTFTATEERLIPTVYESQTVLAQYPGPSTNRRYAIIPSVGMFKWYINDTTTANGTDVVSHTGGSSGRWKLMPYSDAIHDGCYAIATSNITLSGSQTIDGVIPPNGSRVLANAQTTATERGFYVVSTSGAWTRAMDAKLGETLKLGALVPITSGSEHGGSVWMLTTPSSGTVTVGSSTIAFSKIDAETLSRVATVETRTARMLGDEWNPSYLGSKLLAWYRCDVGVSMASATEVASWDDVRGPTGYGPQLTPPTAAHRPKQYTAGGPLTFIGDDSPGLYDGLDVAAPAGWIGRTELSLVIVAKPLAPEGARWGNTGWVIAHLVTLANVVATDGLGILGTTEAYEASGVNALQGLGVDAPQVLIASGNAYGKSFRQGGVPAQESATAMTALAAGARLRVGFDAAGGGQFYPANMELYEIMVIGGRL